jgi:hypothetical protein
MFMVVVLGLTIALLLCARRLTRLFIFSRIAHSHNGQNLRQFKASSMKERSLRQQNKLREKFA